MALGRARGVRRGTQVGVKHSTGSWAAAVVLACAATGCTGLRSSASPNSESIPSIEAAAPSTPVLSRQVTREELSAVAVFRLVFDPAAGCVAFEDIDTGGRVLPVWADNIDVVADQLVDDQRSIRGIDGGLVLVSGGFTEAPFEGPNCGASRVWAVAQSSLCSTDGRSDIDAARDCLSHPAGG